MFGRDGLPLIARSPFSGRDKERLATSYKNFLEKSLHRGATAAGRNSCSVKLVFVDDDDEPLEIQRIWHFNDSGVYARRMKRFTSFKARRARRSAPAPCRALSAQTGSAITSPKTCCRSRWRTSSCSTANR